MIRSLISLLIIFASVSQAEESRITSGSELTISPLLCIKNPQAPCSFELTVSLDTPILKGFCVVSSNKEINMCYQNKTAHKQTLSISTPGSLNITITNLSKDLVLASQQLTVAEFSPSNSRRRRNLGWIF